MARITVKNVAKRFKKSDNVSAEVTAIRSLSIEITDHEFFVVVGPSGCGKSTVLNLIAGLESIDGGEIYFDGEPVSALAARERDVAMVFQSYALYPHMTVAENIAFPLRIRGLERKKADAEVARIAAALELTEFLSRRPRNLSGGQRQRVALARALVRQPKVFLMDEPLSNLDARLRIETRLEIKRLHERWKITTVYVTHDQEEAMVLADRILVMRNGEIQQCGTPREVFDSPANLFTAQFIGSPSMNVFSVNAVPALADALESDAAKLISGIRPSDLRAGKVSEGPREERHLQFAGRVEEHFDTGTDIWVTARVGETLLKARWAGSGEVREGNEISLRVERQKIHFFDRANESRKEFR